MSKLFNPFEDEPTMKYLKPIEGKYELWGDSEKVKFKACWELYLSNATNAGHLYIVLSMFIDSVGGFIDEKNKEVEFKRTKELENKRRDEEYNKKRTEEIAERRRMIEANKQLRSEQERKKKEHEDHRKRTEMLQKQKYEEGQAWYKNHIIERRLKENKSKLGMAQMDVDLKTDKKAYEALKKDAGKKNERNLTSAYAKIKLNIMSKK